MIKILTDIQTCALFQIIRASVVYKKGLGTMAPIILSFYRQSGATPILVGVSAVIDRKAPERVDHVWFLLIGLMGVFLNQTMYTYAVYYCGAALASILQLVNTPVTSGLAIIVGLEKYTWRKGAGVLGAMLGAMLMVAAGKPTEAARDRTLGIIISLVQAIFIACWVIIAKKYIYVKYSSTMVCAGMHVTGLPWMIGTALAMYGYGDWSAFKVDNNGIWVIAYAIIFHSAVAYLCLNYANAHLDASICSTFGTLNPLFGTLAGVFFLGEDVSVIDALGGILIFSGLGFVIQQKYLDGKRPKIQDEDSAADAAEEGPDLETMDETLASIPETSDDVSVELEPVQTKQAD